MSDMLLHVQMESTRRSKGNYGKLTRIWKEGFAFRPVETEELLDTESEYLAFQKEIILRGLGY